jgi:predicted dehydrogenase
MKKNKFRVGLIGAGGIARAVHLPGWARIPEVEIAAVADINPKVAHAVAQEFNIPRTLSDFRDLVKLDLDAVDICTPNRVHTPAVLAALTAGKHVLCEKPLAVTAAEVRRMGQLADRKKLKLMTGQHMRFTDSGQAAKAWAAGGHLGQVYHARVKAMRRAWLPSSPGFIDRKLSGGGPCMDIGVHALDLCLWLMDFPKPVRVSGTHKVNFAKGTKIPNKWGEWDRRRYSVEDFAAGFVHFDNGATLSMEAAWLGHQVEDEDMSCQLFGMEGGLKWPSGEFATVQAGKFAQGTLTNPIKVEHPHGGEIRAFYESVVRKKPSPVPWTETIKVIAILESVYEAQKKGAEVKVKF